MKLEINIDDYITDSDKVELAKQAFKEMVYKNALENFNRDKRVINKVMTDYERVVSNAIFYYLEGEIDSILGQDTKKLIKDGVLKTINKQDYNYSLFRSKSTFDKENSPAQQVVIDTINEIRPQIKEKLTEKLMENISALNLDNLTELINELVYEVIKDKLKA